MSPRSFFFCVCVCVCVDTALCLRIWTAPPAANWQGLATLTIAPLTAQSRVDATSEDAFLSALAVLPMCGVEVSVTLSCCLNRKLIFKLVLQAQARKAADAVSQSVTHLAIKKDSVGPVVISFDDLQTSNLF